MTANENCFMINDIKQLTDSYHAWLKDKTVIRQIDQSAEITTPYLDRHNDYVQIYAKKEKGGFLLTDDGYTITDLEQGGCKLETRRRKDLLNMTLNGFGVRIDEGALQVHATTENFALRKHNLVQAMLAVNDMFYLALPMVASLFYEDVVTWLDASDIRYTPKVKFTGKTGYDHLFHFVIPKSRLQPERVIHAVNHPDRRSTQSAVMAWIDTKEVRAPDSRAYVLLNDSEHSVSPDVFDALLNYDVVPVAWSERESVRLELAA